MENTTMILDIVKYKNGYLAVHKAAPEKWMGRYYNALTGKEFQHEWHDVKIDPSIHWLIIKVSATLVQCFHVRELLFPNTDAIPVQVEVGETLLETIKWIYEKARWNSQRIGVSAIDILMFLERLDMCGVVPSNIKIYDGTVFYYHNTEIRPKIR